MKTDGDERRPQVTNGAPGHQRALADDHEPGPLSTSLLRGMKLLLMFSDGNQLLGVAQLADRAGFSRPTAHRYASTFVQLGYLEQGHARKYRLAPRASDPGSRVIRELRYSLQADEALRDLRAKTGHTVSMGVLDSTRVLYIHRFFGHRRGQHKVDRELRVGAAVPAYCTALGKAMLANLPVDERRELVATMNLIPEGPNSTTEHRALLAELDEIDPRAPLVSDEEFIPGARSIGMSIAQGSRPIAIDVTVPSKAYTAKQLLEKIGPKLTQAAETIAKQRAR